MQFSRGASDTGASSMSSREDNPHYRKLFEEAGEGVLVLDSGTGTVVEANLRFCAMAGRERSELVGKKIDKLLAPADGERASMVSRLGLDDGEAVGRSVFVLGADGSRRAAKLTSWSYETGGHRFVGCRLEDEALSAGSSWRDRASARAALLDAVPVGCQVFDREWRCVYVNAEAARHSGTTIEKLLGRSIRECYPGIETRPIFGELETCMRERSRRQLEQEVVFGDGVRRKFEIAVFPATDGLFVLSLDRTKQTTAEAVEASLSAIVESSDQAIIGKTLDGVITSWNRGAEDLYGYTAQEAVGKPISILIPSGHENELPAILDRIRNGERVPPYETARARRDGTIVEVLLSVSPVFDRQGRVTAASAIALDITSRKEAERDARESTELFETIAKTIDNAFWMAHPVDGRIFYISPAYERIWGRSAASLYDNPGSFLDSIHPDDRRRVRKTLDVQLGRGRFSFDCRIVRPDGTVRWISNRGYPIFDADSRPVRYVGVAQDITERKAIQDRAEEQARLLDVASDVIITADTHNRIRYWNRSAQRVFGLSAEEAVGRDLFEAIQPAHEPEEITAIVRSVYADGEWKGEQNYSPREGRELTMLTRLTLLSDDRGRPKGLLAVATDVTEQRSIERQLLQAQRMESLGALAGGVAHDLNNVLAPIIMGMEGLSLKHSDPETRHIIDLVRSSAERGAAIVRQVLAFARGADGERVPVQVKHILREIESIISQTFPKSVDIRMEIPRNLHLVTGDATQIHQLIMNIAVNARDAMPGGGRLTISARNERLDDSYARMHIDARPTQYVVIEIADTGQGMPQAILEKIFDPFFTTKAKGKGTGLGLSTALSIVKGHGGFINAYSEVGHGSSFKVYFPASDGEVEGDENEVGEVLALGNGELILVADDEEPVLEISRQILESYGYEVLTAKDGTEALISYLREQREVALVVVDMMMPHLDGAGTIRALRKINPRLPIVAMGGLLGSGATAAEDQYDANAFLPKPFTAATLLATLRQLLDRGDNAAPTS